MSLWVYNGDIANILDDQNTWISPSGITFPPGYPRSQIPGMQEIVMVQQPVPSANSYVAGCSYEMINGIPTQVWQVVAYTQQQLDWQLQSAKVSKKASLSSSCALAITGGVEVQGNTFTCSTTDQINLNLAITAIGRSSSEIITMWNAGMSVTQDQLLFLNGSYYIAMVGGTAGTEMPVMPTEFQVEVTDGTIQWAFAGWLLGTTTGNIWCSVQRVITIWKACANWVITCRSKYTNLIAQVDAATTIPEIDAVVWS